MASRVMSSATVVSGWVASIRTLPARRPSAAATWFSLSCSASSCEALPKSLLIRLRRRCRIVTSSTINKKRWSNKSAHCSGSRLRHR